MNFEKRNFFLFSITYQNFLYSKLCLITAFDLLARQ